MTQNLFKKPTPGSKMAIIVLIILVVLIFSFMGWQVFKLKGSSEFMLGPQDTTPSLELPSPSRSPKASPGTSSSPSPSASPSPTSTLESYKIPFGETYVNASVADTNGDSKDETLVVTQMSGGKYHVYVLSATGEILFDDKTFVKKPLRIATQIYDPAKESYLSWMLVFVEQSGDLAFIHWNGTKYEIPQSIGI